MTTTLALTLRHWAALEILKFVEQEARAREAQTVVALVALEEPAKRWPIGNSSQPRARLIWLRI
jgi:hypothetical protein